MRFKIVHHVGGLAPGIHEARGFPVTDSERLKKLIDDGIIELLEPASESEQSEDAPRRRGRPPKHGANFAGGSL